MVPEIYALETAEQMRALADELRQRIIGALADRPMTVTQVGEQLGVTPAKIHYHMRELERVGLVHLVETRAKGSILEKYYQPVARTMTVPRGLLERLSPDENIAAVGDFLQDISQGFMRALAHVAATEGNTYHHIALSRSHLWLTDEELPVFLQALDEALEPYTQPRGIEGERERTFAKLIYDTQASTAEPAPEPLNAPTKRGSQRTLAAGVVSFNRSDLERAIVQGKLLDISVLGIVGFADDVTPDLIEQGVTRFRHKGILNASPEVKAALKRKERS